MRPLMALIRGIITVLPLHVPLQPCQLWPLPTRVRRPRKRRMSTPTTADANDNPEGLPHDDMLEDRQAEAEADDDDDHGDESDEAYANLDGEPEISNVSEDLLLQAEAMQSLYGATKSSIHSPAEAPQQPPPEHVHLIGQPSSSAAPAEHNDAEVMVHDGSQVDEVPDDPRVVPRVPRSRGGPTSSAVGQMFVGGGVLSFYVSKQCFEARCGNPEHNRERRCVLSRSSLGRRVKGHATRMGGRPVAFMYLWLKKSMEIPDRAGHWDPACTFTVDERREAREVLKGNDAGKILLDFERTREAEEPEEAETLVGIWP